MKTIQPAIASRLGGAFAGLMLLTLLTSSWPAALAAPVTAKQAAAVVTGWLSGGRAPLAETLGGSVQRMDTFGDKAGNPLYYVVYLDPSGFVIVAADDLVEPIVGFAGAGQFDPSGDNPLGALVSKDLPARIAHVRQAGSAATERSAIQAQAKWQQLAPKDGGPGASASALTSVSDVRVAPLTQSTWSQQNAGGTGTPACYNYYTPPYGDGNMNNYPAGCVATAMAQLIRYYQFPSTGVGTASLPISIDGFPSTYSLHGGDGSGGAYVWSNMPLNPPSTPSTAQCQAIGALVADAGATVKMQYASGGSSSYPTDIRAALLNTFQFGNAILGYNNTADISASLINMINPNLDARYPVLLSIQGPTGGHAVVADGYGYDTATPYHHLNLGWSGTASIWYALPLIDTGIYLYNVVDGCVYNAYTNGTGEIISGRVLDQISRPVTNATVTATRSGGGIYTTTTDSKGIYALARIPSASSYSITITRANYSPVSTNLSTGTSVDRSLSNGNRWVSDLTMNMLTTAIDHLVWNTVAATQALSTPFAVTLTAQNLLNGPASGFTGSVALSAYASGLAAGGTLVGSLGLPLSGRSSPSGLTHGYAFTPNTTILVTHVRNYTGDSVSIWTDSGTLLASQALSASSSWVEAALATPITLSAGTTYRVSAHYGAGIVGWYKTTWPTTFANGAVGQNFYAAYGDTFPLQVYGTGQGPLVDLRYQVVFSNSIPVSPTSSGAFVNGVWSGNVSLSQATTNVVLKADDGAGHVALSNPFRVIDLNAAPPSITTQPQSRTNNTGDNATFSLIATSSQTPTYLWRRNSAPIGGATASSYTLNNVQLPDSGSLFSCVVSNSNGAVTSQTATLTVICTNVVVAALPSVTLNAGAAVYAVVPLSDGSVIFGGYFTNVNGVARSRLARILANGTLDMTWNPAPNASVYALAVSGTSLYVGGAFTSIGTYGRNYIAKLSTTGTGTADATWNPGADWYVAALAVNGTDLYAGGGFWYMGGQTRNCVAKLSTTGSGTVDATWDPNATIYGYVDAIAVSGANVYIAGIFTNVSGLARTNLAKMNTTGNGAADPTWRPNANWEVYTVATSGTDVYVAGGFTSVGGQSRNCIAKLSSTGTGAADATWNPNADNGVWTLAVKGLCVYAGGSFANIGGLHRAGLAKLSTSGTGAADAAWEADCDGEVDAVVPGSTALYVGGGFTHVAGQARPGIAALTFAQPRLLSPQRPGGGPFQCTLTGERGLSYDILVSTNLVNWDAFTNLASSNGTTNFTDPTTGLSKRFYRAQQTP